MVMQLRGLFYLCTIVLGITVLSVGASPVFAQQAPPTDSPAKSGSSIILFDQSGSMGRYDPLAISKIWLKMLTLTFNGAHNVRLVGFDDDFHDPTTLTISAETDMDAVQRKLDQIETRGKVTDLESPFRFLAGLAPDDDVDLVLIITDGKPEILDSKIAYLSPRALNDPRYADINEQYTTLKKSGTAERDILSTLGSLYQQRNLALISRSVGMLPIDTGAKIIIWDISARSTYLRQWAHRLGAEYMAARVSETEEPVTQLLHALLKLQLKASDLIQEPLLGDQESRREAVLTMVQESEQQSNSTIPDAATMQALEPPLAPPQPPIITAVIDKPTMQEPSKPEPRPAPVLTLQNRLVAGGLILIGFILAIGSLSWLLNRSKRIAA